MNDPILLVRGNGLDLEALAPCPLFMRFRKLLLLCSLDNPFFNIKRLNNIKISITALNRVNSGVYMTKKTDFNCPNV